MEKLTEAEKKHIRKLMFEFYVWIPAWKKEEFIKTLYKLYKGGGK